MNDADFESIYGANKAAGYKSPIYREDVPFGWDQAFSDGYINHHVKESTLLSDRGSVSALSHEYLEVQRVFNVSDGRALTTGQWQSLVDG